MPTVPLPQSSSSSSSSSVSSSSSSSLLLYLCETGLVCSLSFNTNSCALQEQGRLPRSNEQGASNRVLASCQHGHCCCRCRGVRRTGFATSATIRFGKIAGLLVWPYVGVTAERVGFFEIRPLSVCPPAPPSTHHSSPDKVPWRQLVSWSSLCFLLSFSFLRCICLVQFVFALCHELSLTQTYTHIHHHLLWRSEELWNV